MNRPFGLRRRTVPLGLVCRAALLIAVGWAGPHQARAADAPSPALAEIQKAFDTGDYRASLRASSEALAGNPALPPAGRYAALMLRGESLLRLKERAYAIDAFNAASRAAGRDRLKDAAIAKADALLIARSQGAAYKPANGGAGEPIDIIEPKSRPRAMRAAYEDLLAENAPKINAALEGKQLPPMLELVPALGDLYVLETAAAGDPRRTTEVLKAFGQHARSLMESELGRVGNRVDALSDLANSWVGSDLALGTRIDRRGLWTADRKELTDLIDYVKQIRQAAQRARQISISFGYTGENWDPLIAEAGSVLDRADELWDHRY